MRGWRVRVLLTGALSAGIGLPAAVRAQFPTGGGAGGQGGFPGAQPRRMMPVPATVEAIPDVVYGRAGQRELHLDIARPKDPPPGKLPVIVYVHGGAFRAGSHKNPSNFAMAERGYFCVNVEYRLSGEARFPALIHDCKAAIRWVRANAAKYSIDPEKIGVWGHSAGGYLAAFLGATGDVSELEGDCGSPGHSSRVTCVVDFYGPSDFAALDGQWSQMDHMAADSPEAQLLGRPIRDAAELVKQANPITYLDKKDPPFLILHGDRDPTVPFNQSEILYAALQKAGVEATFRPVRGGGHGGPGFNDPELRRLVNAFFDKHLSGGKPPLALPFPG